MRFASLMVAVLASITAIVGASEPEAVGASAIDRIAWLQGCWERASTRGTVEEQWMAPRGGCMIGVGRTVRGDSLFEYEMVVVRRRGEHLEYEAHPSGQPSAVFLSRTLTDSTVVFENLEHDFPQRVGYQRAGRDSVLAWIEGIVDGKARRVDFPYRRAVCPGR
jgi:Domain of unknown function (DUF6265)